MGSDERLTCNKCGFQVEYSDGSAGFLDSYNNWGSEFKEQLRTDVLAGKNGSPAQRYLESHPYSDLFKSTIHGLFQCPHCLAIGNYSWAHITDHNNKSDRTVGSVCINGDPVFYCNECGERMKAVDFSNYWESNGKWIFYYSYEKKNRTAATSQTLQCPKCKGNVWRKKVLRQFD